MIRIGNAIVSLDVVERYFCCDLSDCKGGCCIEGDAGAPITSVEEQNIKDSLAAVAEYLPERALYIIKQRGVSYHDPDGELVTSIIDDKDCVFCTYSSDGICFCALEKGYNKNKNLFKKPISCHLYPVRITDYPSFTAVNYDERPLCKGAESNGRQKNIRAYEFLKEPLIRRFGEEWYNELAFVASEYLRQKQIAI